MTVPGAVRAWADLAERFGRLGLDEAVAAAADLAAGAASRCTARIADKWARAERAPWPAPRVGGRYALPELGGDAAADRRGRPGRAVHGCDGARRSRRRAGSPRTTWPRTARSGSSRCGSRYRDVEVCELPPNGQGAAALIALGIYEGLEPGLHSQIEAMKLALADAYAHVADEPLPAALLSAEHLAGGARSCAPIACSCPEPTVLPRGGTTYLCVVDGDRNGGVVHPVRLRVVRQRVVAPGTGIALQNRAAGFSATRGPPERARAAAKRPFHTIIPGMLLDADGLVGPFGVMGGAMQAQGHFQLVRRFVDDGSTRRRRSTHHAGASRRTAAASEPGLGALSRAAGTRPRARLLPRINTCLVWVNSSPKSTGALIGGSDPRGDGHCGGL